MEISNAELRGRMMVLELLLPMAMTRLATLAPDPDQFIRSFMANAEDMIERAAADAPPDERDAAQFARDAFDELSNAMQQHLAQRASPDGRG